MVRCVGDNYEPTAFPVFGAVAFGLIGSLPSTLVDRSIVVQMRRRTGGEHVERARPSELRAVFGAIASRIARWAADHVEELRDTRPELPASLHDRAQDIWEPLLAIADVVGDGWSDLARTAALKLSGADVTDDDGVGTTLLRDVWAVFEEIGADRVTTQELVARLVALEERPWATWRRGQRLDSRGLAQLLRPFGIRSVNLKQSDGSVRKGFSSAAFKDAFVRYLPPSAPC